jgi:hypothetical protein
MSERQPGIHPIEQEIACIEVFGVTGESGQPEVGGFTVGSNGVTRIEATMKDGMYSNIPYVRVWRGDVAIAEFCQHNIAGLYFREYPKP